MHLNAEIETRYLHASGWNWASRRPGTPILLSALCDGYCLLSVTTCGSVLTISRPNKTLSTRCLKSLSLT